MGILNLEKRGFRAGHPLKRGNPPFVAAQNSLASARARGDDPAKAGVEQTGFASLMDASVVRATDKVRSHVFLRKESPPLPCAGSG